MRISGGDLRGRKLFVPKTGLRPTTDKVRQALFNILGPLQGKSFLDLYSGSGAVGLGAASRGAAPVFFVEQERNACFIIKKNLDLTGIAGSVVQKLAFRFAASYQGDPFDIIFLDPPYFSEDEKKSWSNFDFSRLLGVNGCLIYEISSQETFPRLSGCSILKEKKYGETTLLMYSIDEHSP